MSFSAAKSRNHCKYHVFRGSFWGDVHFSRAVRRRESKKECLKVKTWCQAKRERLGQVATNCLVTKVEFGAICVWWVRCGTLKITPRESSSSEQETQRGIGVLFPGLTWLGSNKRNPPPKIGIRRTWTGSKRFPLWLPFNFLSFQRPEGHPETQIRWMSGRLVPAKTGLGTNPWTRWNAELPACRTKLTSLTFGPFGFPSFPFQSKAAGGPLERCELSINFYTCLLLVYLSWEVLGRGSWCAPRSRKTKS